MPGENAQWGNGFWGVAKWGTVYAKFKEVPEDAYTAFMRRFRNEHEIALTSLAEYLTLKLKL